MASELAYHSAQSGRIMAANLQLRGDAADLRRQASIAQRTGESGHSLGGRGCWGKAPVLSRPGAGCSCAGVRRWQGRSTSAGAARPPFPTRTCQKRARPPANPQSREHGAQERGAPADH